MANPLRELKKLLGPGTVRAGVVVSIDANDTIRVRTQSGPIDVARAQNDATRYRIGDTVILNGSVISGRAGVGKVVVV